MQIYTVEYYPDVKNNEIMKLAGSHVEKIILSELSQTQKDKYCMCLLNVHIRY